jgi:N-methylhydantoinase A
VHAPPVRPMLPPGTGARAPGQTVVHWASGSAATALYARDALGAGDVFDGPAIVTQLDTTTLVPPGWQGRADASGALLLTRTSLSP